MYFDAKMDSGSTLLSCLFLHDCAFFFLDQICMGLLKMGTHPDAPTDFLGRNELWSKLVRLRTSSRRCGTGVSVVGAGIGSVVEHCVESGLGLRESL